MIRKIALVVLAAICSFLGRNAQAQEPTYRLQPLDIIHIQVYNEQQINAITPIGRDGNISAPFIGIFHAEGKTTSELEAELAAKYSSVLRLRDPHVAVWIEKYREIRATVTGLVLQAGNFQDFRPGDTILTLLGRAGGVNPDRANFRRVTLRRSGMREVIPIDLDSLINKGDTSQNYLLQDGDEVVVPEDKKNFVLVLGAVAQPGTIQFKDSMRLADAISGGHGPVPVRAKASQVIVIREQPGSPGNYVRILCNYVRYIKNGDNTQNILLQPGDLVYMSETKTPDFNALGSQLNSAFFLDRLTRDGFLGVRLLR